MERISPLLPTSQDYHEEHVDVPVAINEYSPMKAEMMKPYADPVSKLGTPIAEVGKPDA